jgi:hypothetical protein
MMRATLSDLQYGQFSISGMAIFSPVFVVSQIQHPNFGHYRPALIVQSEWIIFALTHLGSCADHKAGNSLPAMR